MTIDAASSEPQTPERQDVELPPISESKPKKVTLNLKSKNPIPQSRSSSPMSHNELDQDLVGPQENGIRLSVEDDEFDDAGLPADFADTASSALDDTDNIPIEIIDDDGDDESDLSQGAGVTVLNSEVANPMISFPCQQNEPLVDSLPQLCHLLQNSKFAATPLRTNRADDMCF